MADIEEKGWEKDLPRNVNKNLFKAVSFIFCK